MRRFAPEWLGGFMAKLGMEEDVPIESGMVTKAIEQAQTKVEGHNFDIRKHVVEYDDIMNTQRDVIYSERQKILQGAELKANIMEMVKDEIDALIDSHLPERQEEHWDFDIFLAEVSGIVRLPSEFAPRAFASLSREEIREKLLSYAEEAYERREQEMGAETMRTLERLVMLRTIDTLWVEHLTATDEMRQGIGLWAYGQRDPLVQYKQEAHDMWGQLLDNIRHRIVNSIYHVELARTPERAPARQPVGAAARVPAAATANVGSGAAAQSAAGRGRKIGRNDPCPCGSGKKYKKCCGRAA